MVGDQSFFILRLSVFQASPLCAGDLAHMIRIPSPSDFPTAALTESPVSMIPSDNSFLRSLISQLIRDNVVSVYNQMCDDPVGNS
jgi:hypothetical protein